MFLATGTQVIYVIHIYNYFYSYIKKSLTQQKKKELVYPNACNSVLAPHVLPNSPAPSPALRNLAPSIINVFTHKFAFGQDAI